MRVISTGKPSASDASPYLRLFPTHTTPVLALLFSGAAALNATVGDDCDNKDWDQCGGDGFEGETCCPVTSECKASNQYYAQCVVKDLCLVAQFGQCDGIDQDGDPWDPTQKCCPDGFECTYTNQYYSQCTVLAHDDDDLAKAYGQCGGDGWAGPTECEPGYECVVQNEWYSGCDQIPVCTNGFYGQCGGTDKNGDPWTDKHDACCPPRTRARTPTRCAQARRPARPPSRSAREPLTGAAGSPPARRARSTTRSACPMRSSPRARFRRRGSAAPPSSSEQPRSRSVCPTRREKQRATVARTGDAHMYNPATILPCTEFPIASAR